MLSHMGKVDVKFGTKYTQCISRCSKLVSSSEQSMIGFRPQPRRVFHPFVSFCLEAFQPVADGHIGYLNLKSNLLRGLTYGFQVRSSHKKKHL